MEDYFKNISNFYVAGINYKKSDAAIRGKFAVNNEQYAAVLQNASYQGLNELFILSTCNRTEIYGFAHSSQQLIQQLCAQTVGTADTFTNAAYIKNGLAAIEHLFKVGAGLDSQILGDYEIVGQLKTAVKLAKDEGFVGAFTERLINCVLQTSKAIKNSTDLSGGTVSVAFAAVQYIKHKVVNSHTKKILLLGVGKIGRSISKNLVDYLGTRYITLVNRSAEKADELAKELGLLASSMDKIETEIDKADIILVATNAASPVITTRHLLGKGQKLLIDLSIPCNVEQAAQTLPNVQMINIDQLSQLKDDTLKAREAEVPKAKRMIAEGLVEFTEWCDMRRHVPLLRNLKLKLNELHTHPEYTNTTTTCPKQLAVKIQQVLNDTAGKIKIQNQRGCQYITALNNFISVKN